MEGQEHSSKRVKINDEMGMDRLSNLPDSVIHHILSRMDAKDAVQTCVLSKKWKFHWTHINCYSFDCLTSASVVDFEDFVINVLNNRRPFSLSRPKFCLKGVTMASLVKIFYHYAMSYRFEEIDVRKKAQISDHMAIDRLSSLPNPVIYHILSLMDTKYAVQTCVLSKNWRNHWTNIHNLNFDHSSFSRWVGFRDFVFNVLQRCKLINLGKLKFICGKSIRVKLVRTVFQYAISHRLEELETDLIGSFPPSLSDCQASLFECQTLKSLRIHHTVTDFFKFAALKTLQISASLPGESDLFSNCLNLENLLLAKCSASCNASIFIISAQRLVSLTISDFRFYGKIMITAPRLKFFNMKESSCLLCIDKCLDLDEVNILISPSIYEQMTNWYTSKIRGMVEGLCNAKSISVALNLSKGKFIMYYSSVDAEAKVVKLNQDSGEEELLFVFPMVSDLCLDQLATIVEDMLAEKIAHMSNHMEIDRLSNLPDPIIHHILSLMNTKYAVQTCVLSKKWRYHWTHIHSLNLKFIFKTIGDFGNFVLKVFHRRKRYPLSSIKFHLNDYKSPSLAKIVSDYALSKSLEEFDTNLTVFPPSLYQCQNLRTLKLGPCSCMTSTFPDLSSLASLTTLQLTDFALHNCDYFSKCLVLENLSLIDCRVKCVTIFKISAPQLVILTISNWTRWDYMNWEQKIVIISPRLKLFNIYGVNPLVLDRVDCPTLEKVDIQLSPPVSQKADDKKQAYILDMIRMVEGLYHVKSITISLNFSKEKFILYHGDVDGDNKLVELNKETGVKQLIGLATIFEEN
ncbi:hypothetical protein EZV62_004982 [Acer yangbiense]|uniref:F-box domain-containing protein n=1 Tax=Acer yangbiense TaxID=1000413 RepID=A0A5C7IKX4_9ROSI|nr:hypothetical protein EZV62_004982 [Acer yangbiense]